MGLPLFDVNNDPGASFQALMASQGIDLFAPVDASAQPSAHATTVVAVRFSGGVVLVADRQATSYKIASRDTRKIEAADRFSAVAISGSAAAGLNFIRVAQLAFEHYEKLMDVTLSLEGKANYLSTLVRQNNLTTPFTVVPMLAGFDNNHQIGRVFEYDAAGGCYERSDYTVIGSGTDFADTTLRLGFKDAMSSDEAIALACLAVYEAGDNDPSTGGPDFVRGIFPIIVVVDAQGFRELSGEESATRFSAIRDRRISTQGRAGGDLR
jgi:proteasome beta subunit